MTEPPPLPDGLLDAVALLECTNQRRYDDLAKLLLGMYEDSGKAAVLQAASLILAAWRALSERHPAEAVEIVASLREWSFEEEQRGDGPAPAV